MLTNKNAIIKLENQMLEFKFIIWETRQKRKGLIEIANFAGPMLVYNWRFCQNFGESQPRQATCLSFNFKYFLRAKRNNKNLIFFLQTIFNFPIMTFCFEY